MAQEQNEIRRHIAETRREIARDLDRLASGVKRRVVAVADWQRPLRQHARWVVVGGFLGGALVGWLLGD